MPTPPRPVTTVSRTAKPHGITPSSHSSFNDETRPCDTAPPLYPSIDGEIQVTHDPDDGDEHMVENQDDGAGDGDEQLESESETLVQIGKSETPIPMNLWAQVCILHVVQVVVNLTPISSMERHSL